MEDRPDRDGLLDSALQAYSTQEAPVGMEARVLRRLGEPRRGWRPWLLVPALAAAAAVAVLMVRPAEDPVPPVLATVAPPAMALQMTPIPVPAVQHTTVSRRRELTPQQRALLDLATNHPEEAARLVREIPEELSVSELIVTPLAVTELDQ